MTDLAYVDVRYDDQHDILHIHFLPIALSWDDEEHVGIIIRRAMDGERITGVMIMDYSGRSVPELMERLPFVPSGIFLEWIPKRLKGATL